MSAMELLQAEINKKRKATAELIEQAGGNTKAGRVRYSDSYILVYIYNLHLLRAL